MDLPELDRLLTVQDGVVSRAQVLACEGTADDIRRLRRRHEWATVLSGVYVSHTGAPTWQQRAVAGVLHAASGLDRERRPVGAALGGHAAMRAALGPAWRHHRDGAPITVCIDARRTVRPVLGFRFVRVLGLSGRVDWLRTPPRVRPAEAALDLAVEASDLLDAVGLLADACQSRCVSASEVRAAMDARQRVTGRQQLTGVLADVEAGTCSALEHLFLTAVVRAHGMPDPSRQVTRMIEAASGRRTEYRDCEWEAWDVVVELDSRLFHDNSRQRDLDLDRDLDDVVAGKVAVRLGWGQASRRACSTARRVGALLTARGWEGELRRCPECAKG